MKKKIIAGIILTVTDLALLALVMVYLQYAFRHIFGPDFIEYENWFGTIESPIRYRFGCGSAEIGFALLRFICFTIAQHKIMKGQSKIWFIIFAVVHFVIAVLGLIFCFTCSSGVDIIYNIQRLLD